MTSPLGFGNPLLQIASFALGTAAGSALAPEAQLLANEAWQRVQTMPLDPVLLAQGVAQGQIGREWAATEATNMGVNGERFDRLVQVFDTGPGVATAFQLWRRGVIDAGGFRRAAKREGLEAEWIADLEELRDVLLSSDELAMMQQQGFIDAERANAEAAKQGVTAERQQLRFQTSGLPPGIETAFELLRRSIIDRNTFAQIVREGHTKTKYTDELLALEKRVLSAAEYATLHLKAWISEAEMVAGGALTGYDAEAMRLLFLARGRPAAPTQMRSAWAKGIDGPDGRPMDREQFLKGIAESDVRPEWGPMLWEDRYVYPSLFQLSRLVASGAATPELAAKWARFDRYAPDVVEALYASWSKAGKVSGRDLTQSQLADEFEGLHITEAQYRDALTKLGYDAAEVDLLVSLGEARIVAAQRDSTIPHLRTLYVKHKVSEDQLRASLAALPVTDAAIAEIVRVATIERDAAKTELTAAQVRAAFRKGLLDRPTAIADLEERGYSEADANTYLDS